MLTKRQREILTRLANGWQLGHITNARRLYARRGGIETEGEIFDDLRFDTFESLKNRTLIERVNQIKDDTFLISCYDITEAGRLALESEIK